MRHHTKKNNRRYRGFTLVELLVVISIISLLSSIVLTSVNNARAKARDARRLTDVKQIQTALELYYDTNGRYPIALAYVGGSTDEEWSRLLQPALAPYLSVLPKEQSRGLLYLYSSTNAGQKYGLMVSMEHPSNFHLVNNDGGRTNNNNHYYEVGPSPSACAAAGIDWWGDTNINCQ